MFLEDPQKLKRIHYHRSDRQLGDRSMEVHSMGSHKVNKEILKKRQCMREGGSKNFDAKFSRKSMNLKPFHRTKKDWSITSMVQENLLLKWQTITILEPTAHSGTNSRVRRRITLYQILGLWIRGEGIVCRKPIPSSETGLLPPDYNRTMSLLDKKAQQAHSEINPVARAVSIT